MKTIRLVSTVSVAAFCLSGAVAQSGYLPANPITPPSFFDMPTVTAPTVAAPTFSPSSEDFASNSTVSSGGAANGTSSGSSAAKSGATSGSPSNGSSSAPSASALSLLGLGSDSALLKALSGTESDDAGVDALSGLLGTQKTTSDSAALSKILGLLERPQANSGDASPSTGQTTASGLDPKSNRAEASQPSKDAARRIASGGEILRFSVNGVDIVAGVTDLVSSILARDGSFLITADRRYASSGRMLAETFYLLCRAGTDGSYRLSADVSQSVNNPYSFLYRLARRSPVVGVRTGDLLLFRVEEPDFRLDLLIRVISPTGQ